GSDDRLTWTRRSTTQIYAVGGAAPARSTTALVPPTDFRYLEVRATHVSRIAAASVAAAPDVQQLARVPARVRVGAALVVVDLGYPNVPVDELRISSSTPRYDRPFTIRGRLRDGRCGKPRQARSRAADDRSAVDPRALSPDRAPDRRRPAARRDQG